MGNGGIFGRHYGLGSLGGDGLGIVIDLDAERSKARARGCEDGVANKPMDMSRGGAWKGFIASDFEKKAINESYVAGYLNCKRTPSSGDIPSYPSPQIPSSCDNQSFWMCNSGCWNQYPGKPNSINKCVAETCIPACAPKLATATPADLPLAFTGKPCNSDEVKKYVQGVIGTGVDGDWGKASQLALEKYGQPYKDIASGCTGNPPSYGAITGGGGGGTVTTTTAPPPMAYGQPAQASMFSGMLSKPIVWIGLVMAAVGGYVLLTGKKGGKVKRNPKKRPRLKIAKVSWGGTRKRRCK